MLAGCGGAVATPSPAPSPRTDPLGTLAAGTYIAHPFAPDDTIGFAFTVPSNSWEGLNFDQAGTVGVAWAGDSGGVGLGFMRVTELNGDPCKWSGTADDIAVGPTVDDLVNALTNAPHLEATAPVAATISGFSGKKLEITMLNSVFQPTDPEASLGCDQGNPALWNGKGFDIYPQGVNNRWALTILDVQGDRVIILASDFANSEPQRQTELRAIADSIQIAP
jgi:hypothetical protein